MERSLFPGLRSFDFSEDYQSALVLVAADVSTLLGVDFSLGLYDDPDDAPNAAATGTPLLRKASGAVPSDGTIALGRQLVIQTQRLNVMNFGAALSAVLAHEAGHIVQFKYLRGKLLDLQASTLRMELHADFICGYYAAFRKAKDPGYPAAIQAMTQFRHGDRGLVFVPHGSSEQRGRAVYEGFTAARREVLDGGGLALRALTYVQTIAVD